MGTIRLYQKNPVLYHISQDAHECFVGAETFKVLNLKVGEFESLDMEKITKTHSEVLLNQAKNYLSTAERSPLAIENWLKKRRINEKGIEDIKRSLRESGFLSESRYSSHFLEKSFLKGNKPLRLLKRELQRQKIKTEAYESLLPELFDEEKALLGYIKKKKNELLKDEKKLILKLLRRGFSLSLIKKCICVFREQQENRDEL